MEYKVDWSKPVEWDDGTPCTAVIHPVDRSLTCISPSSRYANRTVFTENGCGYEDGPRNSAYVRNVKEEVKLSYRSARSFSHMEDQDLADELKELEAQMEAIVDELQRREFTIDDERYDVPNAQSITKTVELEINDRR